MIGAATRAGSRRLTTQGSRTAREIQRRLATTTDAVTKDTEAEAKSKTELATSTKAEVAPDAKAEAAAMFHKHIAEAKLEAETAALDTPADAMGVTAEEGAIKWPSAFWPTRRGAQITRPASHGLATKAETPKTGLATDISAASTGVKEVRTLGGIQRVPQKTGKEVRNAMQSVIIEENGELDKILLKLE